jgi:hypothetical protein
MDEVKDGRQLMNPMGPRWRSFAENLAERTKRNACTCRHDSGASSDCSVHKGEKQ